MRRASPCVVLAVLLLAGHASAQSTSISTGANGAISGRITCATNAISSFTVLPDIHVFSSAGVLVRWLPASSVCTPEGLDYVVSDLPAGQYFLLARDRPSCRLPDYADDEMAVFDLAFIQPR